MITESSVLALLILVIAGIACAVDITPNEIVHHDNLALNVIDNNNLQSGLFGAFISEIEDLIKALLNGTTAEDSNANESNVIDTTNSNITVSDPSNSNTTVSDPKYSNTTVGNITYGDSN